MEQIDNLKELINQGDVDIAIKQLDQLLQDDSVEKDKDMLLFTIYGEMPTEKKEIGSRHWITTSMLSILIPTAPLFKPEQWR